MNTKTRTERPYVLADTNLFLDSNPREYILKIHDLPHEKRPREKLMKLGPSVLSLPELMAVILNTGTKTEGVMEMSERIMPEYGEKSIIAEKSAEKLSLDLGIPIVKACQIVACGELGGRAYTKNNSAVTGLKKVKEAY